MPEYVKVEQDGRVAIVSLLGRGEEPLDFNPLSMQLFYIKGISLVAVSGPAGYLYPNGTERFGLAHDRYAPDVNAAHVPTATASSPDDRSWNPWSGRRMSASSNARISIIDSSSASASMVSVSAASGG